MKRKIEKEMLLRKRMEDKYEALVSSGFYTPLM